MAKGKTGDVWNVRDLFDGAPGFQGWNARLKSLGAAAMKGTWAKNIP